MVVFITYLVDLNHRINFFDLIRLSEMIPAQSAFVARLNQHCRYNSIEPTKNLS